MRLKTSREICLQKIRQENLASSIDFLPCLQKLSVKVLRRPKIDILNI